jgi:hypothetical protein
MVNETKKMAALMTSDARICVKNKSNKTVSWGDTERKIGINSSDAKQTTSQERSDARKKEVSR